jgi:hypothetical protein
LLTLLPHDPQLAIFDSLPVPVCQFARAYRCRRFAGQAAYGKDVVARQTFYGFRLHARLASPGVITRFAVAPANVHDLTLLPALVEETSGVVGDRNYWSPSLTTQLRHAGLALLVPYRWTTRDPTPARSALLSRVRYRIDTVFSQLVERCTLKRIWPAILASMEPLVATGADAYARRPAQSPAQPSTAPTGSTHALTLKTCTSG